LREHDVAFEQVSKRRKTPTLPGFTRFVDLVDVRTLAPVYAVPLSTIATDDIKIAFSFELIALSR
jgi:hypothetical protein